MENIQCDKCKWAYNKTDIIWIGKIINKNFVMVPYCEECRIENINKK